MKFERVKAQDESLKQTDMEDMYTLEIAAEQASQQLQFLNSKYPLPLHLDHVKRIWRTRSLLDNTSIQLKLLLSPVNGEYSQEEWYEIIRKNFSPLSKVKIQIEKVPKRMPYARNEYEQWRSLGHWPTKFHEQKTLLKEEADELKLVEEIGLSIIPMITSGKGATVIILDPRNPNDLEFGLVNSNATILDEPVMLAIQAVATKQLSQTLSKVKVESPPNHHHHYLCTGYFAFCLEEPSIMSAMALVHSRIRAVIFINENPERGGLYSRIRLQEVRETNHHFSVFRCYPL